MSQENVEIVRRSIEAWNRRDQRTLMALYHRYRIFFSAHPLRLWLAPQLALQASKLLAMGPPGRVDR